MSAANTTGEVRRDAALAATAQRNRGLMWVAQARMLESALRRDKCAFTGDDATAAGDSYTGNAPWIGAAVRNLAMQQWVHSVGFVRSARPTRKANFVRQWAISNSAAALCELKRLQKLLGTLPPEPTAEPMLFNFGNHTPS